MSSNQAISEEALWNACGALREEGMSVEEYVEQFSGVLFMKICDVSPRVDLDRTEGDSKEDIYIPDEYRWDKIVEGLSNNNSLEIYEKAIENMEGEMKDEAFSNFQVLFDREPTFERVVEKLEEIDALRDYNSFVGSTDAIGDAYEFLLEKYADKNDVSGEYFTPRPIMRAAVNVAKPDTDDRIIDPAAGTNGFIIEADNYLREHNDLREIDEANYSMQELRDKSYRLGLMNLMMHGINPSKAKSKRMNTLSGDYNREYDIVISNPPYGTSVTEPYNPRVGDTIEFQFMKAMMDMLDDGGKAALVIPEGILFNRGAKDIRKELLEDFSIEVIVAMPEDMFQPYAGIDTNLLIFKKESSGTDEFWFYDARTDYESIKESNQPNYEKHFADFVDYYDNREEHEEYFKVDSEEIDEDKYELHLKKYKEFKYEGHRPPAEIAEDIKDELDTIRNEIDQMVGDKDE